MVFAGTARNAFSEAGVQELGAPAYLTVKLPLGPHGSALWHFGFWFADRSEFDRCALAWACATCPAAAFCVRIVNPLSFLIPHSAMSRPSSVHLSAVEELPDLRSLTIEGCSALEGLTFASCSLAELRISGCTSVSRFAVKCPVRFITREHPLSSTSESHGGACALL